MFRAPVDVVTGYLGSGKTTLVRRLLGSPLGARVAVVVNEIAGLDVDGRVLRGLDGVDRAVELAGGCVCCEIEESRFARAIGTLLERVRPDLVVVETSGAAEPGATVARLRDAGLTLDAVVALLDAEHGDRVLDHPLGRAQVAGADFVVVNRVDLAAAAAVDALAARVGRENPRALVLRAIRAEVDPALLFATGAAALAAVAGVRPRPAADIGAVAGHGLEARVHRSQGRFSVEALVEVLEALPDSVHRAKGIVRVPGSEFGLLFNAVRRRVETEWLPFPVPESRAVVVGEDLAPLWEDLREALLGCEVAGDPGVAT